MLPEKMIAVQLSEYRGDFSAITTIEKPIPKLKPNQVLIKMSASTINPSDLSFLKGEYGVKKKLPVVPGFEGSGTVVAAGGNLLTKYLKGKRVACTAPFDGDGTWAEYMAADAGGCIPLKKYVTNEMGCSLIVNPLSAYAMVDIAKRAGHKAIVQTAAASSLGRMVSRLAKKNGIPVINIVRREEQMKLLESDGAEHILNSADAKFERAFLVLAKKLNATAAFDAVGGQLTLTLLGCMPNGSSVTMYGGLSGEATPLHPGLLIFKGQTIQGFWLSSWLGKKSTLQILRIASNVQKLLASELKTEIRSKYGLKDASKALQDYSGTMTGGKVIFSM